MRIRTAWILAPFLLVSSLHAEERHSIETTPIEIDENGMLIVKVKLSACKPDVPDRVFRFIFDTGATMNLMDESVPSEFFLEEPSTPKTAVTDATGGHLATRMVRFKRMELAGMVRDNQRAYRMDLKGALLGRIQDQPVDGFLGMNFLHGTRLVLDRKAQEIRWWDSIKGHRVPILFPIKDRPSVTLKVAGTQYSCLLDTGASRGFTIPRNLEGKAPFEPFLFGGISGGVKAGKRVTVNRIETGGRAWVNASMDLVTPGESEALLGRDVLCAAPLELDFIDGFATFTIDADGNLPYQREPDQVILSWDRNPQGNRLLVERLNPLSPEAMMGLKKGDALLRVGPLEGAALNIRSVRTFTLRGEAHTWVVRRNGEEVTLNAPAAMTR